MRFLVLNGPNLNQLGQREPDIYGRKTYADLERFISDFAANLKVTVKIFQSNHEGALIDEIQTASRTYDGIVINPGALTHYSYALYDALRACAVPAVEVHLTNIAARDEFRRVSVTAPACAGQISGLGFFGYSAALTWLLTGRDD